MVPIKIYVGTAKNWPDSRTPRKVDDQHEDDGREAEHDAIGKKEGTADVRQRFPPPR